MKNAKVANMRKTCMKSEKAASTKPASIKPANAKTTAITAMQRLWSVLLAAALTVCAVPAAAWADATESEPASTLASTELVVSGMELHYSSSGVDDGYATVSTDMGANPACKVNIYFRPSDEALAAYQEETGLTSSAAKKQLIANWVSSVTSVTVDGVALEAQDFSEWKSQLTDAVSDAGKLNYYQLTALSSNARFYLPIALFDTTETEKATVHLVVESSVYETIEADVTYRNLGASGIVVRVLSDTADNGGEVLYETTITDEQMKQLQVQSGVCTSANCGMAGLRSYMSEGVALTDLLTAAGVEFGEGMTLKLRTTDCATTNDGNGGTEDAYYSKGTFTYENLLGTTRYHFSAMWDNETVYDELDGQTIYSVLADDIDAWKSGGTYQSVLPALISESKVEVEPVIAWAWNEGVVGYGGSDPETQSWNGQTYNGYTAQETYRFLFGMATDEDGIITDETTTNYNSYGVFGIDIINPDYDANADTAQVVRLGGTNRYATMALVSKAAFATKGSCSTVVVCRGDNFPDALAAAGLAGVTGGQVLLTKSSALSSDTAAEIERLGATKVYVIGDENSVSLRAYYELSALVNGNIERIGGSNRQETALKIYQAGISYGWGTTCFVATGAKAADSLSASSVSYCLGAPIFLTSNKGELSSATLSAIKKGGFTRVVVLGDKNSVSDNAYKQLASAVSEVVRLGGANRYETSQLVARWAISNGMSCTKVCLTAGRNGKFADALAASALAGKNASVLLLVDSSNTGRTCIQGVLSEWKSSVKCAYVLGDTNTVSAALYSEIEEAVGIAASSGSEA